MASQGILGMWGGIGQGLAMVGQQGMKDQSEQARINLAHSLELERDELQAGRASDEAEKERTFRSEEAEAARAAAADEAEKARTAEADLKSKEWDREDARVGRSDAARVKAAEIKAGAKWKNDKIKQSFNRDDGTIVNIYESGITEFVDPATGMTTRAMGPGERPANPTSSMLDEADAVAKSKAEDMTSLFKTEAGEFKDYGGKRDQAENYFRNQYLSERYGYGNDDAGILGPPPVKPVAKSEGEPEPAKKEGSFQYIYDTYESKIRQNKGIKGPLSPQEQQTIVEAIKAGHPDVEVPGTVSRRINRELEIEGIKSIPTAARISEAAQEFRDRAKAYASMPPVTRDASMQRLLDEIQSNYELTDSEAQQLFNTTQ